MKEECKVPCDKITAGQIVVKEGTNTPIFLFFDYGAGYGAECNPEYGAKQ